MARNVFVFGRPGSGKSTAARHIQKEAGRRGLNTIHMTDLTILYDLFHEDKEQKQFLPNPANDFDVIDFSVYDTALLRLGEQARKAKADLVVIEFARDDYKKAFTLVGDDLKKDARFLFCEATTETCLSRVHGRNINPVSPDAHPTRSDERYREYYGRNNFAYMSRQFAADFHIAEQNILCIFNEELPAEEFQRRIHDFAETTIFPSHGKETPFSSQQEGREQSVPRKFGSSPERR